jgi:hypothetical protein
MEKIDLNRKIEKSAVQNSAEVTCFRRVYLISASTEKPSFSKISRNLRNASI